MKKGISLIVLVITIIIIIILAGAVILNMGTNNPIKNSTEASILSEQSDINHGLSLYLGTVAADNAEAYEILKASDTAAALTGIKDVAGNTLTGYYLIKDVTAKCGTSDPATAGTVNKQLADDFAKDSTLLAAIGMSGSKYVGSDATDVTGATSGYDYYLVMNLEGNVKIVKK